jgi:hypothetical protein
MARDPGPFYAQRGDFVLQDKQPYSRHEFNVESCLHLPLSELQHRHREPTISATISPTTMLPPHSKSALHLN